MGVGALPSPHPASPPESPSLPLARSSPLKALTRGLASQSRPCGGSGSLPEKVFELRPRQAKPHLHLCAISPCLRPFPCLRATEKSGVTLLNLPFYLQPPSMFLPVYQCTSGHPIAIPETVYLACLEPCPSSPPPLEFAFRPLSPCASQKALPRKYAASHHLHSLASSSTSLSSFPLSTATDIVLGQLHHLSLDLPKLLTSLPASMPNSCRTLASRVILLQLGSQILNVKVF